MLHDSSIVKKKDTLLYKSLGVFLSLTGSPRYNSLCHHSPSQFIRRGTKENDGNIFLPEKKQGKNVQWNRSCLFLGRFSSGDEKTPEKNW